jgi:hypothetical protein
VPSGLRASIPIVASGVVAVLMDLPRLILSEGSTLASARIPKTASNTACANGSGLDFLPHNRCPRIRMLATRNPSPRIIEATDIHHAKDQGSVIETDPAPGRANPIPVTKSVFSNRSIVRMCNLRRLMWSHQSLHVLLTCRKGIMCNIYNIVPAFADIGARSGEGRRFRSGPRPSRPACAGRQDNCSKSMRLPAGFSWFVVQPSRQ